MMKQQERMSPESIRHVLLLRKGSNGCWPRQNRVPLQLCVCVCECTLRGHARKALSQHKGIIFFYVFTIILNAINIWFSCEVEASFKSILRNRQFPGTVS